MVLCAVLVAVYCYLDISLIYLEYIPMIPRNLDFFGIGLLFWLVKTLLLRTQTVSII